MGKERRKRMKKERREMNDKEAVRWTKEKDKRFQLIESRNRNNKAMQSTIYVVY